MISHRKNQEKEERMDLKTMILKDIPLSLHTAAKIQAAKEGITLKAIFMKALEEYLEKVSREDQSGR